jgi:hypothetical protein
MSEKYVEKDGDDDGDGNGDGNKQKGEDASAGALADCDKNEVDGGDAFDCIAAAASHSERDFRVGDGGDDGVTTVPPVMGECPPETIAIDDPPLLCLVIGVCGESILRIGPPNRD